MPESYDTGRYSGAVTDRDFKGFVLSQQRTRNVKCPDCGKWAYDHPGRLCECGGIRRAQGNVYQEWCEAWARECLRVLKPGGHMLAFGGTRTWHRLTCAIEDAGFEIRDSVADLTGHDAPGLMWVYGSGFPKSLDVSKAIDKAAGVAREVIGEGPFAGRRPHADHERQGLTFADDAYVRPAGHELTAPATEDAARWEGWGTALKPAWEPIVVARKPLAGTVASNVLEHGTGALNIAGCRLEPTGESRAREGEPSRETRYTLSGGTDFAALPGVRGGDPAGRWPPNVLLGPDAAAELDAQSGVRTSGDAPKRRGSAVFRDCYGDFTGQRDCPPGRPANEGGASRFFPVFKYEAKAGAEERPRLPDGTAHPTVKPRDLIAWLVRLVTPPGGLVLDPFGGSGTTAEACIVEGFRCVLIEKEPAYAELIRTRLRKDIQPAMFGESA
jgi:site-specific DNA-methyltransferase (adenine-specific)